MDKAQQLFCEINKSINGKEKAVRRSLAVLLAGGHLLLEDIPGVGKTTLSKGIAAAAGIKTSRIQFTPDTLPSDITGFTMWDEGQKKFTFHKGAVMTNILLADEINRTSPRTQSALLQAMEEGCVTEDGRTYPLEEPFMVIATQNPLGSAGTMPLPPSQLDRFMMRLSLGRPSRQQLAQLLTERGDNGEPKINAVCGKDDIINMKNMVRQVNISQPVADWIAELTEQTHSFDGIIQGASPRAAISLMNAAKAEAYLSGREYILPCDIAELFADCFAHRLVMKSGFSAQKACEEILKACPPPHIKGRAK